MNSASPAPTKARPKHYDTNLLHLPVPGLLSILRRVSGAVMFLVLLPLLLVILQQTLRSESGFMQWKTMLAQPLAEPVLLVLFGPFCTAFFPAGLLAAYRFLAGTRDQVPNERLDNLEDPNRLFRHHTIMNCVDVCRNGLNPSLAIGKINVMLVTRAV